MTRWTVIAPSLALAALIAGWGRKLPSPAVFLVAALLGTAVLAAVHHAEVIARRVGEPFGSLTLAVAVTVIEIALIITLMLGSGTEAQALARDTVFAAVMITCNGVLGLSLLVGTLRDGRTVFNAEGSGAALATIATIATISLVLASFTTSAPGPEFSTAQLAFAGAASFVLYCIFVTVQTVLHRSDFLPVASPGSPSSSPPSPSDGDEDGSQPTNRDAFISLGLLLVALVAVVGDAKLVSPTIESSVSRLGLPQPVVGVIIAMLVLAPETAAAVRAAQRGHMQTSLNLAFGSSIASIGLTIPAIAVATIWLPGPLVLGLNGMQRVLFTLTMVVGVLTVVPGRATLLQAGVHLSLFATFLFLAVFP